MVQVMWLLWTKQSAIFPHSVPSYTTPKFSHDINSCSFQAAIVAKELNEFLSHYRRETEFFTVFREEAGMVPRHTFEEFVAFANDSDLEEVLTLQTKLYRCAHIFLGKCLPPVNGKRHSLLR